MMMLGNIEKVDKGIWQVRSQHRIKNIKEISKVTLKITFNLII